MLRHWCADLLIGFLQEQKKLIGEMHLQARDMDLPAAGLLRVWDSSDDTSIMISGEDYRELFQGSDERIGNILGGMAYHSCGVWEKKSPMVKGFREYPQRRRGIYHSENPSPNDPGVFGEAFAHSGIILNARAVGDEENSFRAFEQLWRPGQRLICVTYCKTPEEQERLYRRLHELEEKTGL